MSTPNPFESFPDLDLRDMRLAIICRKADVARVAGMCGNPRRWSAIAEEARLRDLLLALDAEAARRGASRLVAAVQGLAEVAS